MHIQTRSSLRQKSGQWCPLVGDSGLEGLPECSTQLQVKHGVQSPSVLGEPNPGSPFISSLTIHKGHKHGKTQFPPLENGHNDAHCLTGLLEVNEIMYVMSGAQKVLESGGYGCHQCSSSSQPLHQSLVIPRDKTQDIHRAFTQWIAFDFETFPPKLLWGTSTLQRSPVQPLLVRCCH